MSVASYRLTKAWLGGGDLAYPGHPLILATLVMSFFTSYGEASKLTEHGWEEALGDPRIPGAGDTVTAAMWILKAAADGASVEELVAQANGYWTRGRAGIEQARLVEPIFREKLAAWNFGKSG